MPDDLEEADEEVRRRGEEMRRRMEDSRRRMDAERRRIERTWHVPGGVGARGPTSILEQVQLQLDATAVRLDSLNVPSMASLMLDVLPVPTVRLPTPPPAAAPPRVAPAQPPKSLWERLEEPEAETTSTSRVGQPKATSEPSGAPTPPAAGPARVPTDWWSDWWIPLVLAVLWAIIIGAWSLSR